MVQSRPLELMRDAVVRGDHQCSLCGRPCGEDEARRHTEPGPFGDSSKNFAAMCYGCQTWLAHEGVKPARYIVHFHDASRIRRLIRKTLALGALILTVGTFVAFAAFAGAIIYRTPHTVWNAFGTALLLVLLFSLGGNLVSALLGRSRGAPILRPADQPLDRYPTRVE